jgi:Mlc titration factor MtfA (ptsG expression regulator)
MNALLSQLAKLNPWKKAPVPLIPLVEWQAATRGYRFMRGLSVEEERRLRFISSDFLTRKNILGAAQLDITPRMQIEIAAQASTLVLEMGLDAYEGWTDIIVYPSQFMPEREVIDAAGVVHTSRDVLAGEAWLHGPVVLSYEDVARTGTDAAIEGFNVVIHEFAHKLDMRNGDANGFPVLPKSISARHWERTFKAAYLQFCEAVDTAEVRARLDGGAALDRLPLDPYASENPAEFFAVISEAFFEIPGNVRESWPEVYDLLAQFYGQDTFARQREVM